MHPILEKTLAVLFPACCVACGEDLPASVRAVCPACWSRFPINRDQRLPRECGVDAFQAAGDFAGPLREAIHAFKFGRKAYVGECLADLMAVRCSVPSSPGLIVPVPAFWWREVMRGFNPPGLLAEALGRRWGTPVRHDLLRRRAGLSQIRLGRQQRWANAHRVFRARKFVDLTGRTVVLVDDVCTSGATLAACARVLRLLGARAVFGVTAARESGTP